MLYPSLEGMPCTPPAPTPGSPWPGLPTSQLFLDLCAPSSPQEVDSLSDPILPPGLQLVGDAPENQVTQGPGCSLLDVLVGAPQEVHQLADASQLIDLLTHRCHTAQSRM